MNKVKVIIKGVSPLMMHNERLANPLDPATQALKELNGQRKKTDELRAQIAKREWFAGMYEKNGRPVIPADNILATVKEGARKNRLGKQVESGVFSEEKYFELEYDGPKDIEALWDDGRFFDYRSVAIQQNRVMRARPRFDEWSATVTLVYDPDTISEKDLLHSFEVAGMSVGLCEKRPQFGRFQVSQVK